MKFHLTENGPKECRAQEGKCPITAKTQGEHFENFEKAQKTFEKLMEFSGGFLNGVRNTSQKPTFAPEKPFVEPVTLDEAQEGLERVKAHLASHGAKLPDAVSGNLTAYTLSGSLIYNLHHPESDRDIHLFTDSMKGKDVHIVFDDGSDFRVSSLFTFSQQVMDGYPNLVDLWSSKEIKMAPDSNLEPYLNSLSFNKFNYVKKTMEHGRRDLHNSLGADKNQKRSEKHIKTAFRHNIIVQKFMNSGIVNPKFSDAERESFYESYNQLLEWIHSNRAAYAIASASENEEMKDEIIISGEEVIYKDLSKKMVGL